MIDPEGLARALADDREPSATLAQDVMRRVRREASGLPPLGFPWRRGAAFAVMPLLVSILAWNVLTAPVVIPILWSLAGGAATLLGLGLVRAATS